MCPPESGSRGPPTMAGRESTTVRGDWRSAGRHRRRGSPGGGRFERRGPPHRRERWCALRAAGVDGQGRRDGCGPTLAAGGGECANTTDLGGAVGRVRQQVPAGAYSLRSSISLNLTSGHMKIARILNRHQGKTDHLREISLSARQDVVDDLLRRRDLAVAVMPGVLHQFQEIESRVGSFLADSRLHPRLTLRSPGIPSYRHASLNSRNLRRYNTDMECYSSSRLPSRGYDDRVPCADPPPGVRPIPWGRRLRRISETRTPHTSR